VNTGVLSILVMYAWKVDISGMKYVTCADHDSFCWLKGLLFVYAGCINTSLTA
jgi:hypothetical protein